MALAWALLAFACQGHGDALFDNSNLGTPSAGGVGAAGAGASSSGGSGGSDTGATSTSGSASSEAGESGSGANAAGGSGGDGSEGGSAGARAGGSGEGGSAGTGRAGSGGTKSEPEPEPEPVTIELTAFEDTYVSSCADFTNFGGADELRVDAEASSECVYQSLFRVGLEQIPEGALVSNATLTLTCVDAGGSVAVSHAAQGWVEDSVRWHDRPDSGDAIGSLTCDTAGGTVTLELKATLVAWLAGELPNHGLYFRTEAENGTDLVSSESPEASARPTLSVTYTLPVK